MALFSSMLRRRSSSLFSLALRTVGSARTFHRPISTVPSIASEIIPQCSVPFQRFSTATATATAVKPAADDTLVRVLESEIKLAEEDIQNHQIGEVADGFPFEIVDVAGEQTIMLKREFEGEIIKVAVDIPNVSPTEDSDNEEDEDTGIPMVVSISKGNGQELEFGLTAFSDEICIDSLSIRQPEDSEGSKRIEYEGPNFSDLDKSLQKAFQKYLEVQGIKSSITDFLQEYMRNKDFREYLMWLKNLKGFIEQ